ncbi:MAG: hypothetical protein WBF90_33900 [Rivularia sp. (in: cyanobacteria)]
MANNNLIKQKYGASKTIPLVITEYSLSKIDKLASARNARRNWIIEYSLREYIKDNSVKLENKPTKGKSSTAWYSTAKKRTTTILSKEVLDMVAGLLRNTDCSRSELIERLARSGYIEDVFALVGE